jgi:hypothetical protein
MEEEEVLFQSKKKRKALRQAAAEEEAAQIQAQERSREVGSEDGKVKVESLNGVRFY